MKTSFTLCLLLSSAIAFCQMPTCTGGNSSSIVCYGDFENFTSSIGLNSGLINGVYSGSGTPVSTSLNTNLNSNPTNFVTLTSCPNSGVNLTYVLTFPLKSPLYPCASGNFSFNYSDEPDASILPNVDQSRVRVYFFENDLPTVCANLEFMSCGGSGNYDLLEFELFPTTGDVWQQLSVSYQNNTADTYNYVAIEYIAMNGTLDLCRTVNLDNINFLSDPISEEISLTGIQGIYCKADEVQSTKIQLNHNFCQLSAGDIQWSVVTGDFNSIQTSGVNNDFIWVLPTTTTVYQVTVTTPTGNVLTSQFTVYVGAHAGTIVPSTYSPPNNTSFLLTLTGYNGGFVTWQKSTRLASGAWTPFVTIQAGALPALETIWDTYTGRQSKYRAIVRCGTTSSTSEIVTIGKGKSKSQDLTSINNTEHKIFPNPTTDYLNVNAEITGYKIYDLNGNLIKQEDAVLLKKIDVSNVAKGFYMIEIDSKLGQSIHRFIKN